MDFLESQSSDESKFFIGDILGLEGGVGYFYTKDVELYAIKFIFTEKHTNKNSYISDYKGVNNKFVSKYGNPPTDETNHFPSYPSAPQIFTSGEVVVSDSPLSIGCYKYEIFTFSEAYINYYFYSQLNLKDPSRSNLRDSGGDVVIGAFGAMSGKTIQFRINE